MLQQNRKAESQMWGKQDGYKSKQLYGLLTKNRILNPLLTPRPFVHRLTTLHVHCLHTSYWPAPFHLQNIVDSQLATFQSIVFFGLVHPLLWISHFYFFFDFASRTPYLFTNLCVTYFSRAELADSHATLTWDAQKSCAQTIGANVFKSLLICIQAKYFSVHF